MSKTSWIIPLVVLVAAASLLFGVAGHWTGWQGSRSNQETDDAYGHMIANQSIEVEFKRVMKSFGTKRVLNDVSFQIRQGQAMCLLGRSGTGKSVTLKLIMALLRPDFGEVWVDQEPTALNSRQRSQEA